MGEITVSIVSHGHADHIRRLLGDLNRLAETSQIVVVLTLNIPEPAPCKDDFPRLRMTLLRNARPQGFGANHNAAFVHCATPWFAVMNPDLRLPEDPFEALLSAAQHLPDVALFSPSVVNSEGAVEDHVRPNLTLRSLLRRRSGRVEFVDASRPCRPPCPFYWLAGMFMLFRTEAFQTVRGFDERFFLYCEDYDICARLYARGHGLALVPKARAIHDAQRDSHRSARHLRWHLASLAKVWTSRAFWTVNSHR